MDAQRIVPESEAYEALLKDIGSQRQPLASRLLVLEGGTTSQRTAVASRVAGLTGLPIQRIDLSQVVSKYIGETEKNLSRALERAAGLDVVLLFDEADALFGKRTEPQDAHDRYANREAADLLRRLKEFNGLAILSANQKAEIDEDATARSVTVVEVGGVSGRRSDLLAPLRWLLARLGIVRSG